MPREDGQFKAGNQGKPRGAQSGRTKALGLLDTILSEDATQKAMQKALRQCIKEKPIWAFTTLVMPLLPKNVELLHSGEIDINVVLTEDEME
jgi:predicted glycosyltransferase